MLFSNKLYVSKYLKSKQKKVILNLKKHKLQFGVFVICLSTDGSNHLEIFPSYVLLQKQYKNTDIYVVGLAEDMNEAVEITRQIVTDIFNSTDSFDYINFFKGR